MVHTTGRSPVRQTGRNPALLPVVVFAWESRRRSLLSIAGHWKADGCRSRAEPRIRPGYTGSKTRSDGALGSGRDQGAVFGENAGGIPRGGSFPLTPAALKLWAGNLQVQDALVGIDRDGIAF